MRFDKAVADQPMAISAKEWNQVREKTLVESTPGFKSSLSEIAFDNCCWIEARNISGFAQRRGTAIVLHNPMPTLEDDPDNYHKGNFLTAGLTGVESSTVHSNHLSWGIWMEDVRSSAIGKLCISGYVAARVDVEDENVIDFAEYDFPNRLRPVRNGGARIVYLEGSGTGERWGIIHLGPSVSSAMRLHGYVLAEYGESRGRWASAMFHCDWMLDTIHRPPEAMGNFRVQNPLYFELEDNIPARVEWNHSQSTWDIYAAYPLVTSPMFPLSISEPETMILEEPS